MEEEKIIAQASEKYEVTNIEIDEQAIDTEIDSTYVMIDPPEEVTVGLDEALAPLGGGNTFVEHNHNISEVAKLEETLNVLASPHEIYSQNGGYAEFREWLPIDPEDNTEHLRGIGYFVSLVHQTKKGVDEGNTYIDICKKLGNADDVTDVYGVTVADSGFCGYQNGGYNILVPSDNKENPKDANGNNVYEKVCLLGNVKTRVHSKSNWDGIKIGDYVVPDMYGCAIKSSNNVGFKVISRGYTGIGVDDWYYVSIALVPQNDNVARVMKELEGTRVNLENISLQIGKLEGNVNDIIDTNISISGDFENIKDLFEETTQKVETNLDASQQAFDTAQKVASQAKDAIESMNTQYTDALGKANEAVNIANDALSGLTDLSTQMEPLYENKDDIVGFFAGEGADGKPTLATLVKDINENEKNISSIKQTGDAIQFLVAHADMYSIGKWSLTYGLSYDEAKGVLEDNEYIYVPTYEHTEESYIYKCRVNIEDYAGERVYFEIGSTVYSFVVPNDAYGFGMPTTLKYNSRTNRIEGVRLDLPTDIPSPNEYIEVTNEGRVMISPDYVSVLDFTNEKTTYFESYTAYEWVFIDGEWQWQKMDVEIDGESAPFKILTTNNKPPDGRFDGDLWYCSGVIKDPETNKVLYTSHTLYRYDGVNWIAVATINDSGSRATSLIKQTADSITSTVTDVQGNVSTIKQTVSNISSTVSKHTGELSNINQTANNIMMGVYDKAKGSSSLEVLLTGMNSTAVSNEPILVGTFYEQEPSSYDGKIYSQPPTWVDNKFVFAETTLDVNGEYYFHTQSTGQFCKTTTNGYEIYTIGNQAMASLNTRVSETESEVNSWTSFKTEVNEAITSITQNSNEDAAEMVSMVFGQYKHCTETKLEITEEELDTIVNRYQNPPTWEPDENGKKRFTFGESNTSTDGLYCIPSDGDGSYYYELLLDGDDNIVGYKKYEMKSSDYASLVQKVEDGKSYVGLFAGNDDNMGSVVARTINDKSEVLIEADKIGINGTAVFRDNLNNGTTTISGNYISTGTIKSNNYSGPITYKMYGLTIKSGQLIRSTSATDCIYYAPIYGGTVIFSGGNTTKAKYYCEKIEVGVELSYWSKATSQYIVSLYEFDIIPYNVQIDGTKFDLNLGTIYSKNLILDPNGDVSITGKITATSGYIGNRYDGFQIQPSGFHWTWSDSSATDKLKQGTNYYLLYGSKYYCFSIPENLSSNIRLAYILDYSYDIYCLIDLYDGTEHFLDLTITDQAPNNAVSVNQDEWNFRHDRYGLGHSQRSVRGKDDGEVAGDGGVFISPRGIGLGHGRVMIPSDGAYLKVAGGKISRVENWSIASTGENKTIPVWCLSMDGTSTQRISIGQTGFDIHYSSLMIIPRTRSEDSENAQLIFAGTMYAVAFNKYSDYRLKTNIVDSNVDAVQLLNQIQTKSFDWINGGKHTDIGLIAQQLETVIPDVVATDDADLKSIDFMGLIPYLIKATQQLSERIAVLEGSDGPSLAPGESVGGEVWEDTMTIEDKQYYVELSKPPQFNIPSHNISYELKGEI